MFSNYRPSERLLNQNNCLTLLEKIKALYKVAILQLEIQYNRIMTSRAKVMKAKTPSDQLKTQRIPLL